MIIVMKLAVVDSKSENKKVYSETPKVLKSLSGDTFLNLFLSCCLLDPPVMKRVMSGNSLIRIIGEKL